MALLRHYSGSIQALLMLASHPCLPVAVVSSERAGEMQEHARHIHCLTAAMVQRHCQAQRYTYNIIVNITICNMCICVYILYIIKYAHMLYNICTCIIMLCITYIRMYVFYVQHIWYMYVHITHTHTHIRYLQGSFQSPAAVHTLPVISIHFFSCHTHTHMHSVCVRACACMFVCLPLSVSLALSLYTHWQNQCQ